VPGIYTIHYRESRFVTFESLYQEEFVANHKSAEKRNRQAIAQRLRNRAIKTRMKNLIRLVDEAVASGSVEQAQDALKVAIPVIAKTGGKGTIHKKNASRKVSQLTKRVNKMQAAA
jgi:small subunit ribosomal protein S20